MSTNLLDELCARLAQAAAEANASSPGSPLTEARPTRATAVSDSRNDGWPRQLPRRVICDRSGPSLVWPSTSLCQENR